MAKVCVADELLAYNAKPDLNGEVFYCYPDSSKIIPIYTDSNGNRISKTNNQADSERKFLFFGCSFTFGEYSDADSTYPFRVSRHFGAQCINTAMTGHGYSQMLAKARKAIPLFKPEVVFVQYSDWLIDRSQSVYNIALRPLKISNPFFFKDKNGMRLSPPLYSNRDILKLIVHISVNRTGLLSQVALVLKTGLLMMKHDFISVKIYFLQKLKSIPAPSQNDEEILEFVLAEFQQLCAENNCKLVVVGINKQKFVVDSGFSYVNTHDALVQNAERLKMEYKPLYHHWTLHPPTRFDKHPNHYAHHIIASTVIQYLLADSLQHRGRMQGDSIR